MSRAVRKSVTLCRGDGVEGIEGMDRVDGVDACDRLSGEKGKVLEGIGVAGVGARSDACSVVVGGGCAGVGEGARVAGTVSGLLAVQTVAEPSGLRASVGVLVAGAAALSPQMGVVNAGAGTVTGGSTAVPGVNSDAVGLSFLDGVDSRGPGVVTLIVGLSPAVDVEAQWRGVKSFAVALSVEDAMLGRRDRVSFAGGGVFLSATALRRGF